MSSSIAIPAPPPSALDYNHRRQSKAAASSSSSSSYSSSPSTPSPSAKTPSRAAEKQKMLHSRRPSLLSPALSKEECTTINVADEDGPPRLISYLTSSQGFVWNPEMFLPPYVDYDFVPLEHRREPVHEILVSDEEIRKILPQ
ncbi:hypothetical protein B0T22DRAFT_441063 [Podospora appendiculata]|uniref:Uncharacterized protein n=1 Tax=Podospora appendiculata TaxID=314037 RepID=A0AAE0XBL2_9PEZI|nr:hypothetical protein B0T22DRAFT_441063 [Podospora appendiculata]